MDYTLFFSRKLFTEEIYATTKFHGLHTILIWHHCLYITVVEIVSRYIYFVIPVGRNVTSVGENNYLTF